MCVCEAVAAQTAGALAALPKDCNLANGFHISADAIGECKTVASKTTYLLAVLFHMYQTRVQKYPVITSMLPPLSIPGVHLERKSHKSHQLCVLIPSVWNHVSLMPNHPFHRVTMTPEVVSFLADPKKRPRACVPYVGTLVAEPLAGPVAGPVAGPLAGPVAEPVAEPPLIPEPKRSRLI